MIAQELNDRVRSAVSYLEEIRESAHEPIVPGAIRTSLADASRWIEALSESLSNALRHADSPRANIDVDVVDGNLQLTVVTEGSCVEPESPGLGPVSLRRASVAVELFSRDDQTELVVPF